MNWKIRPPSAICNPRPSRLASGFALVQSLGPQGAYFPIHSSSRQCVITIQSICQSPINRYGDPFYTFDLWLRPWWKHLTSQVPGQRSVFMLSLIFNQPVRLPVGKHPGWADQTPESVPCLDLFVSRTYLANMVLGIATCCPQSRGRPRQKSSKVKCISYQVQDSRSRQVHRFELLWVCLISLSPDVRRLTLVKYSRGSLYNTFLGKL